MLSNPTVPQGRSRPEPSRSLAGQPTVPDGAECPSTDGWPHKDGWPHTLAVDATYLLKRSVMRIEKDGGPGVVYGFLTTIRMLLRQLPASKCVLLWDGENSGKLRYRICREYKANRKGKSYHTHIEMSAAEIAAEEKRRNSETWCKIQIQKYAEELFLRNIESPEVEADDLAAAYCQLTHPSACTSPERITLFTNDRDYCQLLSNPHVSVYLDNLKQTLTRSNYREHFDHHPDNSVILKIMLGDTSDNIRGIAGVGESTLLKHVPELADRPMKVREVVEAARRLQHERTTAGKQPLAALRSIIEGREVYMLNRQLVDLSEPLLTDSARLEVRSAVRDVLSPEGRSSRNLAALMQKDGFLAHYGSDFVSYVAPFYPVIVSEKTLYEKFVN